jgi:hypothetical protein
MRPTAIGAPAPEPDDSQPSLHQRISRLRAEVALQRRMHDSAMQRIDAELAAIAAAIIDPDSVRGESQQQNAKIQPAEIWALIRQLKDMIPPTDMGPEIPGLDLK